MRQFSQKKLVFHRRHDKHISLMNSAISGGIDWKLFRTNEWYQAGILSNHLNTHLIPRVNILGNNYKRILTNNFRNLKLIRNKTYDMCEFAVFHCSHEALEFVDGFVDDDFYIKALTLHPYALKWINNPSHKVCKYAVSINGDMIQFVQNQTYELQLRAIKQNINSIKYCINPCRKLKWLVINKRPDLIVHMVNRSQSMVLIAVQIDLQRNKYSNLISQIPLKFTRAHDYVKLLRT